MRIRVQDIGEEVRELDYDESAADLNQVFNRAEPRDYRFVEHARVSLRHYRAGQDLCISGRAVGAVVGRCARCLDEFPVPLDAPFSFVLLPRPRGEPKVELEAEDLDLSYYDGEEIDLSPLVQEQVVLAMPTRPLCRSDCRGLCPRCGANRNRSECACAHDTGDPRLAVLRKLNVGS